MAAVPDISYEITRRELFAELTLFLARYSFIYNFKVTEFLSQRVWEKIPPEWVHPLVELSFEELNEIPFGLIKSCWPHSLLSFIADSIRLSSFHLSKDYEVLPVEVLKSCRFGMSPKKLHEVSHLAALINSICCKHGCKLIVDLGSGLGYLDLVLSMQFGYEVLGLESHVGRASGAGTRASNAGEKRDMDLLSGRFTTKHFELTTDEENVFELERLINEKWPPNSDSEASVVCLVGLHCCGDLTPAALTAFSRLPRVKSIVCLGCCYHRMQATEDGFLKLPMSNSLKETLSSKIQKNGRDWQLTKYAFRLAAQETRTRWRQQTEDDHRLHTQSVAYRGIFELNGDLAFTKQRRKLVRKNGLGDFESYIDEITKRTTLSDTSGIKDYLLRLFEEYQQYFKFIEPYTLLQVMVQPVLERLIMEDRVSFLQEQGFQANVQPVFDDYISPRNYAIVAFKG